VLRVIPSSPLTIGSGTCAPKGSSRRDLRERSMSRHTRATTVVIHPPRFSTPRTGAAEMEPGLLHGDVRLARRAEHRVRPQVGPVGLELLRQRVVLVHRSHSSSRSVITVTNETQPDVTRRTESEPRRSASRSASDRPLDVTTRHLAGSGPAGRHRAARSSLQQGQTNQGGGAELPAFGALPRIRSIRTSLE
jgi:hypothetical protein